MQCPIENTAKTEETDILLDYCANKLSPECAAEVERHMKSCSACASFSSSQRHVWTALDSWEPAPVSEDFNRRLYARIEQDQKQPSWQRWLSWRPAMSFAAAMAAVVMFVLINTDAANQPTVQETSRADVDAEQVELVLEDLEMLKQLSASNSQNL
jgi:anti-sigma factor RsiW